MTNLLVLNTSITGDNSYSRKLVASFTDKRLSAQSHVQVKERDLGIDPLPHLSGEELQAWSEQADSPIAALSDNLIAELAWADEIVLGLPMYNFDSPSNLKAWFDRVVRAGKTFRYTEQGPEGLLKGKKVTVIASRGGKYVGTPLDTQSDYIKNIFNFIGIMSVNFVYAEGLAMGTESADKAITSANEKIDELIASCVD